MTRKGSPCPAAAALSHAFPADADDALRAHLAECPACAAEWAACERLAELGRELPRGLPTAQRRDDVRRALLAAASRTLPRTDRPHRLLPWAAAAAALCAGLAVAMFALAGGGAADRATTSPGASRRATLHPQADAVFAVVGVQPDEIVRLSRGTLTVEVAPLRPGERFRVATADAQVEVRGTVFDVVASDDRLAAVRVLRGRVEVRRTGRTAVVLDAGQHWDAAPAVAQTPAPPATQCPPEPPPPAVAPVLATPAPPGLPHSPAVPVLARPVPRRDPPAPPAPEAATDVPAVEPPATEPRAATEPAGRESAEQAFAAGWAALNAGDDVLAAQAFRRAADVAGDEPLAEDASFWHAVALGRNGRDAAAGVALDTFLARFPRSPRAGEASAMLGWILLSAGDGAAAEARFRSAVDDPVPSVRESARSGLAATRAANPPP
jgi:hypothetical protein